MTAHKIRTHLELLDLRKAWQQNGERVVFTNGCFDILHLGHIDYLEKAAAEGDRLVVAVNSDESVRRLKGKTRPLNNSLARCRLLAALAFTDAITVFSDDTPAELIALLMPDILVKGADYDIKDIVGADIVLANGGEVRTIELVAGYSTTGLLARIRGSTEN